MTRTAPELQSPEILLNGNELRLSASDGLPPIKGIAAPAGEFTFAPASFTFLALPDAGNTNCR
jgi:hypothetical protein